MRILRLDTQAWVRFCAGLLVCVSMCRSAPANWARCTFSGSSIQTKSTWIAGTDAVNLWFGLDWGDGSAGYAHLNGQGASTTRSLVQAMPDPVAGTYKVSVQYYTTNANPQTAYWHVLAVTAGTVLSLGNNGIPSTISQTGVKSLYKGTMPANATANTWNTVNASFAYSAADATTYQYLVIALVGASPSGQTLRYDNILFDAPVASTATAGLTCDWITIGSVSSVSQLNFSSPARTSFEGEVYWMDSNMAYYPGGPANNYAMRLRGTITIPTSGNWTFTLGSDDGSQLKVNNAVVVLHDGAHSFSNKTGVANLSAGNYPIEVVFFENGGSAGLQLLWQGPGMTSAAIVPWTAFVNGGNTRRILNWTSAEPGS